MSTLAQRRIDVLDPILGRWQTTGAVLAADGSAESRFEGSDTYERLGSGFVVHRVDVRMAEGHVEAVEVIGDYDPELDALPTWSFDGATGGFEQSFVTLDPDGALVFRSGSGHSRAESRLRVESEDRMTGKWQLTDDDGASWTPWMRLELVRERTQSG